MVKTVCDVQTKYPKAAPVSSGIPYNNKTVDIAKGYAPRPPLEKPTASVPKMNPITTTSKLISDVSGKAKIVI